MNALRTAMGSCAAPPVCAPVCDMRKTDVVGVKKTDGPAKREKATILGKEVLEMTRRGDVQNDALKQLVDAGADLDFQDKGGWTAVMWAVRNGDITALHHILEAGADLASPTDMTKEVQIVATHDLCDKFQTTALMLAARDGRTEAVQMLVDKGADLDMHDEDGRTSLHQAAKNGYVDALCVMVVAGAQLNDVDQDGRTAVYWAVARDKADCLMALVEAGADLDVQDKDGRTAAMFAAENGLFRVLQALIEGSAALNSQDACGRTAAMLAADNGHTAALRMLIEAGADVQSMRNRDGQTAVQVAGQHVLKALLEADPSRLFPGGNQTQGNYLHCFFLATVKGMKQRLGGGCW